MSRQDPSPRGGVRAGKPLALLVASLSLFASPSFLTSPSLLISPSFLTLSRAHAAPLPAERPSLPAAPSVGTSSAAPEAQEELGASSEPRENAERTAGEGAGEGAEEGAEELEGERSAEEAPEGFLGTRAVRSLPLALRWPREGLWSPAAGTISVGLWELAYAPKDWLNLELLTLPMLLNLHAQSSGLSAGAQLSLWSGERWSLSAALSYLQLSLSDLGGPDLSLSLQLIPARLTYSWRFAERWLFGASLHVNTLLTDGEGAGQFGALNSSNRHLRLCVAWAFGERWSLWLTHNRVLSQTLGLQTQLDVPLSGGGRAEIFFTGGSQLPSGVTANGARLVYRRESVSFSFGFESGAPPIYLVGTASPAIERLISLGFLFYL